MGNTSLAPDSFLTGNPLFVGLDTMSNYLLGINTYAKGTGTLLSALTTSLPPSSFSLLTTQIALVKNDTLLFLSNLKKPQGFVKNQGENVLAQIYAAFQSPETNVLALSTLSPDQATLLVQQIQEIRDLLVQAVHAFQKKNHKHSICT
jgi:uncharacterized membrane protein